MKITTNRQVWGVVAVVDTIGAAIVVSAILAFYPPELWPFELAISLTLTFGIATPITYFMAQQLRKIAALSDELQRLVNRDRLTDVATRNYFFARMEQAPGAYGISLMIDIDHFKRVNDTHGHFAGDQVIKDVASILGRTVRSDDIVARFGGEEFVVFLYDQDTEAGFRVAERMRAAIASETISFEGIRLNVTVSIGGSLKQACDGIEQAIQEADEALYRAKREGRNRTIFSGRKHADKPDAVAKVA